MIGRQLHCRPTPVSQRPSLLQKHIALPQQHGARAIWLGPFAIGIGVSETIRPALLWLVLASTGGFLLLQPFTLLIKVLAGRRPRADLAPALFWAGVYGFVSLVGAFGLIISGNAFILWLGLAALPVLTWQMLLVARRAERGQMGVELVGAGVLCLSAPAAYWVNNGTPISVLVEGWWLFVICWLQAAGAIVYIYLRLEHRRLTALPAPSDLFKMGWRSTLYNTANVVIVTGLAIFGIVPVELILPFALLLMEAIFGGLLRPGIGAKPVTIGVRQVLVTVVFAVLTIIAYRVIM